MTAMHLLEDPDAAVHTRHSRTVDVAAATEAARDLLFALGADLDAPGLRDTPRRVALAYLDLLTPQPFSMTTFANEDGYDGLVVVRDISFVSLCEHHVLPFVGVAHVGYVPARRIVGLSKLARAVEHVSRRLQVQERMTVAVADLLEEELDPRGVAVVIEAEHTCMSARGVRARGARTTTSTFRGCLCDDPHVRTELLPR
jgi:GTP cyclohydrolase I